LYGIASLPVLYVLAKHLTSHRVAVFAVFVLAISPFHIWYSQEVRMYSQLLFLSLLSSVLLLQALQRGEPRWWVCYIFAGAAGMYTHVFMGLVFIAQFLCIAVYDRRYVTAIVASGATAAILFLPWALFLPWIGHFVRGVSKVGLVIASSTDGRAGFTLAALPYTLFVYGGGFSLGPTIAELHSNKSLAFLLNFLPSIAGVMIIFVILLGSGIFLAFKHFGRRSFLFCFLGLFVPLAGTVAYSLTPRATFNVRYTVIAYPYFCLFVGIALAHMMSARKVLGATAVLVMTVICSVSLYNHFANPRYAKEDVKSAVAYWRRTANNEPLLAIGSMYPAQRYVGESRNRRLFLVGSTTRQIRSRIENVLLTQNISSAYILVARDWDSTAEAAIRDAFAGTLERSFPGVKVFRISRPRAFKSSDRPFDPAPSRQL
jgi:uncharacterized membrane protein